MAQLIDIHTHHTEQTPNVCSIYNVRMPNGSQEASRMHSIGWHPWDIENLDVTVAKQQFLDRIQASKTVAIGECGLDRACPVPIEAQIPFFEFQVEFAKKFKLPLIIHCVRAYSEVLGILQKFKFHNAVIFHAYRGNNYETQELSKLNAYFSFGIRKGQINTKVLTHIPFERLFLETDDSDSSIEDVYKMVSKEMCWNVEWLEEQILKNYKQVFGNGMVESDAFVCG